MKSYVLAIALAMLVAAGFVFQNPGIVTVHFLIWTRELPQGVWEVVLFAAGGILMWGVSLVAMMEVRNKYRREIRTRDRRVQELQEERDSLVSALNSIGPATTTVEGGEVPLLTELEEEVPSSTEEEESLSSDETSVNRSKKAWFRPWSHKGESEEMQDSLTDDEVREPEESEEPRDPEEQEKPQEAKQEGDQGLS